MPFIISAKKGKDVTPKTWPVGAVYAFLLYNLSVNPIVNHLHPQYPAAPLLLIIIISKIVNYAIDNFHHKVYAIVQRTGMKTGKIVGLQLMCATVGPVT
jgi:uncharacterized membrane protein